MSLASPTKQGAASNLKSSPLSNIKKIMWPHPLISDSRILSSFMHKHCACVWQQCTSNPPRSLALPPLAPLWSDRPRWSIVGQHEVRCHPPGCPIGRVALTCAHCLGRACTPGVTLLSCASVIVGSVQVGGESVMTYWAWAHGHTNTHWPETFTGPWWVQRLQQKGTDNVILGSWETKHNKVHYF